MLTYIIDAFNVIHKIGDMVDSPTVHNDFVNFVRTNNLTGSTTNDVVIVFDGYEPTSVMPEHEYQLIFSGAKSADDVIKARVAKAKNRAVIVVVTDDNSVRNFARGEGAHVMAVEEFLSKSRRYPRPRKRDDDKEIDSSSAEAINRDLMERWVKKR